MWVAFRTIKGDNCIGVEVSHDHYEIFDKEADAKYTYNEWIKQNKTYCAGWAAITESTDWDEPKEGS